MKSRIGDNADKSPYRKSVPAVPLLQTEEVGGETDVQCLVARGDADVLLFKPDVNGPLGQIFWMESLGETHHYKFILS
jgi:hypothetical protein